MGVRGRRERAGGGLQHHDDDVRLVGRSGGGADGAAALPRGLDRVEQLGVVSHRELSRQVDVNPAEHPRGQRRRH